MKVKGLIIILITLCAFTCEEDLDQEVWDTELVGHWVNEEHSDTLFTYQLSDKLNDNEYGFSFNANGRFVERKNSGWCGTPPISYADFNGSWSKKDSIISIAVDYWGGIVDYEWEVISLKDGKLTIAIISQDFFPSSE